MLARLSFPSTICLCFALLNNIAQADLLRTLSGGEIRGELQVQAEKSRLSTIKTQSGALISISPDQVDFLTQRSAKIEDYVSRSRNCPQTVEARLELAAWCKTESLQTQRLEELRIVLEIDPNHADARRELGYVHYDQRWLTEEEWMHARGYLRYRGRWITRQELEVSELKNQAQKQDAQWRSNLSKWTGWLNGNRDDLRQTAMVEIKSITDPDAIPALNFFLGRHSTPAFRQLHVQTLENFTAQKAIPTLINIYLTDPDEIVAKAGLAAALKKNRELTIPFLMGELRNPNNVILSRAAVALGDIGDQRAVTPLIHALITIHSSGQNTLQGTMAGLWTSSQFDQRVPQVHTSVASNSGTGTPSSTRSDSTDGKSLNRASPHLLKIASIDVKNEAVLEALHKLTGKNFGFNQRDWHQWWAIQQS